ncbi:MAG: endonuclease/exonuclease/phosphatase family protein [Acidimicrobiales bacterium]
MMTLPVAGLAGARLAGYDRWGLLAAANAGTPFVYLPAYGGLLAGIIGGRKALTALAASVAVAHVAWTAPELRGRRRPPSSGVSNRPRLRVLTANLRYGNPDVTAIGTEIADSGADIVLLQELVGDHLTALKAAGAFDRYSFSLADPRRDSFGGGIWSRYPLSEGDIWEVDDHPTVRATADVEGTQVRLYNLHAKAPSTTRWIGLWKTQLRLLGDDLARDPRPAIMAGDYNATFGHKPFRDLLARGLSEAHMEAGRGMAATWPQ